MSVVKYNPDQFAVFKSNPQKLVDIIHTNLGEQSYISVFQLDQVRTPSGGGLSWEVPTLDGVETMREIEGIIIHHRNPRQYYQEEFSGESKEPDCSSDDGAYGIGIPGGDCSVCPLSQWGSGKRGKGSACQPRKQLFVLRQGDILPMVINLPTTSIKPISDFMLRVSSKMVPFYGVIVSLGLEVVNNGIVPRYSRVTVKSLTVLDDEHVQAVELMREAIVPLLQSRRRDIEADVEFDENEL